MNSLEIKETLIDSHLKSLFYANGYQPASPGGMEFRNVSDTSAKGILFLVYRQEGLQMLDLQLGIEFKMIASLLSPFMSKTGLPAENYTLKATPHQFNCPPLQRFMLTDEASLQLACRQIKDFMQKKGFRFLNTFDKLKRADSVINRKPHQHSSYLPNQVYRCFVGITMARLLQRTDFETLGVVYRNYLYSHKAPERVTEGFQNLLNYLRYFSFN